MLRIALAEILNTKSHDYEGRPEGPRGRVKGKKKTQLVEYGRDEKPNISGVEEQRP